MDAGRVFQYLISGMEPLIPAMIFTAGVTVLAMVATYLMAIDTWFDQKRFRVTGIFYGLNGYDCYRLAVSWVRLLLTVFFIAAFHPLEDVSLIAYLMVGVLYILDVRKPKRILKNLFWMVLITAGLLAANLVCGYIGTLVTKDVIAYAVYVFMGVFMALFAFYLFMQELEDISTDRRIDPEKDYERTVREN